jgi:glycosyltransferase 2 family protein
MVALVAVAFAGLGVVAAAPDVATWERAVFRALNNLPGALWVALYPVMQAGSLAAGPVAALAALAAGRRRLGLQLLVAGPAGWIAARVAKAVVERPRPSGLLADVVVRGGETAGLGYPSGHVTVAAALAVVCAVHLPRRWQFVPWLGVAGVGVGRIAGGAHLPLDVLGGLLLGLLVGAGTAWLLRGSSVRRPEASRTRG